MHLFNTDNRSINSNPDCIACSMVELQNKTDFLTAANVIDSMKCNRIICSKSSNEFEATHKINPFRCHLV